MKNKQIVHHLNGDAGAVIATVARSRFQRFGYAKTSMQEIAEACHMSAANLYRFYDGKLAIGAAIALEDQSALLSACDRAVSAAGESVGDKLIALFLANIDETRHRLKRTPLLVELGMIVAREIPEWRRQFLHEFEVRIAAILAPGSGGVAIEPAAIGPRTRMILMACAPFVLPWMLLNVPFGNPRSMVEPLIHSLVSGMGVGSLAITPPAPSCIS